MPFPETNRVFYGKNPLEEVVCQLRFPPVLRIDTETPAAFQDQVRQTFPLYQRAAAVAGPLTLHLPPELLQALSGPAGVTHEFASADQVWKLSLARDFIALTTSGYTEWADFRAKLQPALEALISLYATPFFLRVGLRYRDRIDREAFGLSGVGWRELLKPEALGELGDADVGPHVDHILREMVVRLEADGGQVRIVHGLQREAEKLTYIIDCDFFTDKQTEAKAVVDVLNAFNRRAGHLFRWYITPRLHAAMEPHDPPTR